MDNHVLSIDNRERLTVTAVKDVSTFNEEKIMIVLAQGNLEVKGEKLNIQKLDLAEGKISVNGSINSVVYTHKKDKEQACSFLFAFCNMLPN